ncbi:carboxypeptidase-like regulatory domain-containing protein [uncultured Tenacibaculum sp.]|uniref:carboxypeptidase-like regulatory domain-containing protein n=1 Tax=uncultured Tenacibaculum sp. TaxID=174713 RepID=UPI002607416F|nr:carboxypeptidase-like regulatory domain-containing protein [uncultured Tenacibaculum sp.]
MESDLPIFGLACPSTKHDQQEFNTTDKKCGCTMKQAPQTLVNAIIINESTNKPFEAGLVNVYNINTKQGTMPDANGNFTIHASPNDVISISFVGFNTIKIKASELPKTIALQEANEMLNEVIITGKKQQQNYLYAGLGLTALLFVYAIAKDDKKSTKKTSV